MKRWEVGFLSGWLIGGTIFCFILPALIPHPWNDAVWHPFWPRLLFSFGWGLYIGGPIGVAAAYFPWHRFARRRKPTILGCGQHSSLRSRLVMLPGSRCNREFVAIGCKSVLKVSRDKWNEKLAARHKVSPPPLTRTEWKVINYRINPDPPAIRIGKSCLLISSEDAD